MSDVRQGGQLAGRGPSSKQYPAPRERGNDLGVGRAADQPGLYGSGAVHGQRYPSPAEGNHRPGYVREVFLEHHLRQVGGKRRRCVRVANLDENLV